MIIKDKPIIFRKNNITRARNYLYTMKMNFDPVLNFLKQHQSLYTITYLLSHPELFKTSELYTMFKNKYNSPVYTLNKDETVTSLLDKPSFNSELYKLNMSASTRYVKPLLTDKNIPVNQNTIMNINRFKQANSTTQMPIQKAILKNNLDKLEQINEEQVKTLTAVQRWQQEQNKLITARKKKLDKNVDNRVSLTRMRMRTKNRPVFKIWNVTPNPRTRHTTNDGQKVPLDEPFIIENDKTGVVDELMYPGDVRGTAGNIINCLCKMDYTNNPSGLLDQYKGYKGVNNNDMGVVDPIA